MVFIMNNENGEHFCAFIMSFCLKMLLPPLPSQILTELLAQEVGEMGLCRHLPLLPALATPCPGRRGSAGIVGVRVAPMPIFLGGVVGFCSPSQNQRCGFSITQLNAQLGIITSAQSPRLLIIGM